jgi:uncharacterized protein (DUF433 family)
MWDMTRTHFTMRMSAPVLEGLAERAEQLGESRAALVERYVDEGLKQDAHPAIVFRDGPLGRRALLAGTRLEVWQVIETLRNSDNSLDATAQYLSLPVSQVQACLSYYAAHQDEVDAYASRARTANERAEQAWRREQDLLTA